MAVENADRLLAELLKNKEYDFAEIEMQLFENCNLACSFCSQDHAASLEQTSLKSLLRKAELTRDFVRQHSSGHVRYNLMGGEVFQDKFENQYFEDLKALVLELSEFTRSLGKKAQFVFTTNFIFQDCQRVENFLKELDGLVGRIEIATSFDFKGRAWTEAQKKLFQKNVEFFQNRVRLVGVVLHRFSIRKMMEEGDPLFDWLYARVPVVFEYYIPDLKNQDKFSPSDQENLKAFLHIARHFPKAEPVSSWLGREYNEVRCCSLNRITILADDTISSCRYFPYKPEDFKTAIDRFSIGGMALKFMEEQNCLGCEHFKRCGMHCFVQADRAAREKSAACFLKDFFTQELGEDRSPAWS